MASFFAIPRELRDKVYAEILTAPGGIYLSSPLRVRETVDGRPRDVPLRVPVVKGRVTSTPRREGSEFLHTALLYVCRQASHEAADTLYAANVFHVPTPLAHFVHWLAALPPRHRARIRRLEFMQRLLLPLLFDNTRAWKALCALVAGTHERSAGVAMRLTAVSVHVPLDFALYEPSRPLQLRMLLTNSEQFWWPALKFFAALLAADERAADATPSLFLLHLRYPSFERRGIPDSHMPVLKPFDGDAAVDVEELEAVRMLRIPREPGDEPAEDAVLDTMMRSGTRGKETHRAWKDFHQRDAIRERKNLSFRTRWVSGCEGQELVLSNGRLVLDANLRVKGEEYGIYSATKLKPNPTPRRA